ncbi:hypothetical protein, partial [Xanthomonas hyacinthi]|uniref:hypothetical protein n=1 Tax=Xanthomonas hyacinthi TaxID=56455 RepID=UPI001B80BE06
FCALTTRAATRAPPRPSGLRPAAMHLRLAPVNRNRPGSTESGAVHLRPAMTLPGAFALRLHGSLRSTDDARF